MTRLRRRLLIAVGAATAAFVAYGIWNAGANLPSIAPSSSGSLVFGGGVIRGERLTGHSWSISYDRITSDATQTMMQVDGVRDGIIYVNDRPYLRFTADHAIINAQSDDFSANGRVHVEAVDKHRPRAFDTDDLEWTQALQRLTFPHLVTIRSRGSAMLQAESLTIDVAAKTIHVEHVRGRFLP